VPHCGHISAGCCAANAGGETDDGGVEAGEAEDEDAEDAGRCGYADGVIRIPQTSHQSEVLD
jgi:hypothetical protein